MKKKKYPETASLWWQQPDLLYVTLAITMGKMLSDAPIVNLGN